MNFCLKTSAISQKQKRENDAATLESRPKEKKVKEKNDITKQDLKFVSDAVRKCLNKSIERERAS